MGWADGTVAPVEPIIAEGALPCPFCGEVPAIEPWHGGAPTKVLISCAGDDCDVIPSVSGQTPEEAYEKWNRRVT